MTDQLQTAPAMEPASELRHRNRLLVIGSALAGVMLSILWDPSLVDKVIAGTIANPVVGGEATKVAITGPTAAAVFAFITGVGGMFTACNIAVFGAIAPMSSSPQTIRRSKVRAIVLPIAWLAAGAVVVAGLYGVIGVLIGDGMPQLSNARIGDSSIRVRSIQSAVVFTLIGSVMIWYALAAIGLVRNPLERVFRRHPWAEMVFLGALVGGFLIGRPFGMFRHMYEYAAATGNPLVGFMTFALQSLGNIVGVATLLLLATVLTGGRFQRWLAGDPHRAARFTSSAFIVFGTFFVFYWGVKLVARA